MNRKVSVCKENPKKFWKYVRSKTKDRNDIGHLKITDESGKVNFVSDDKVKSNIFSDYFSSVFTCEPKDEFQPLKQLLPTNNMDITLIPECDVAKKLHDLKTNKSPGPDGFHPRILKEVGPQICSMLTKLYNLSIESGQIPDDWKLSTVSVIHKKGSKSLASNYRPISLTCIACKILESIIRDQIMYYFISNDLFTSKQFGFINCRTTVL